MFATVATSTMTIRRVEIKGTLDRLAETIRLGFAAHRQRRALANLTDVQLADIGLSARTAMTEAHRSFWDVPTSWRR